MLTKILSWILSENEDVHVERKVYVQNEMSQLVPKNTGITVSADLLFRP